MVLVAWFLVVPTGSSVWVLRGSPAQFLSGSHRFLEVPTGSQWFS